jgi:hypothetical protein
LDRKTLIDSFLTVFCDSISAFILRNCSDDTGEIRSDIKWYIKMFLDSSKIQFINSNELVTTFRNLIKEDTSTIPRPIIESRFISEPLGEELLELIKTQDETIMKEKQAADAKEEADAKEAADAGGGQVLRPEGQGGSSGRSQKKNKHNITKKYRTKTRKSRQTRRNKHKHKHNHIRTIKRRKSRRNNSN